MSTGSELFIRDGKRATRDWTVLADDAPLPSSGKVLVSLARWRKDAAALATGGLSIGVVIPNTEDVTAAWPEIKDRPVLALHWPAVGDGRAYSQARLLRERFGFKGELRATGEVTRDLLQLMHRCGINAFELRADQDIEDCLRAFNDFSIAYQNPTGSLPNVWDVRRAQSAQA